ncbi:type II toxin-antitoxin system Phd/YefM family antitoxin [Synergistaceae bacterium OttesenSCG-928-I11]|nr:type II toxin-antitoxin system Phd/YefM family antitoxin [Synergistaceae bacterium OttesenSCG-928-I11]
METMNTMNTLDARNSFSDTLRKAQRSPVRITKRGKPIAVVMSVEDYEATEALKARLLEEAIAEAREDLANGRILDADQVFDELEAGLVDSSD